VIGDVDHVSDGFVLVEDVEFGDLSLSQCSDAFGEGIELLQVFDFGEGVFDCRAFYCGFV
jgi:hypothetical protein